MTIFVHTKVHLIYENDYAESLRGPQHGIRKVCFKCLHEETCQRKRTFQNLGCEKYSTKIGNHLITLAEAIKKRLVFNSK